MIIREEEYSSRYLENLADSSWQQSVFFDIETTGLGWRSSHIYLIGVLFCLNGKWTLRQWFLDRPFAEKDMLESFSRFLRERNTSFLADYNGSTFDLPYLRSKFRYYNITYPEVFTEQEDDPRAHKDIFRLLRPLKTKLPLSSLKLQEVEKMLSTDRTDTESGKDLIEVYHRFLQTGDPEDLDHLFLHNYEDVAALPAVVSLLSFHDFWCGQYTVTGCREQSDRFLFELAPGSPFPAEFVLAGRMQSTLSFSHSIAVMSIPVSAGERKLFFSDPKQYYYLPDEDQAVHKSVGVFIDPAHRVQASASNCYQRMEGHFLPCPSAAHISKLHCFYEKYRDKTAWIRTDELLSCGSELQNAYTRSILSWLF